MYYQIAGTLRHQNQIRNADHAFFAVTLTPDKWRLQKTQFNFPDYIGAEGAGIQVAKRRFLPNIFLAASIFRTGPIFWKRL